MPVFSRGPPAVFGFNATLDLQMNTAGNVIPIYMKNVHATIYSTDTEKAIATGDTGGFWRRPGAAEPLGIPIQFSYTSDNSSDATCELASQSTSSVRGLTDRCHPSTLIGNVIHNACEATNLYASGVRPSKRFPLAHSLIPCSKRLSLLDLNIILVLSMSIRGMINSAGASTTITDLPCPITLPSNE